MSVALIDIETLRRAHEQRDADLLTSFYTDDADIEVVDKIHPPSSPLALHGKRAITDFWRDICSRDMTHHVEHEVLGTDRLAFEVSCQYSTGQRVLAASTCEVQNGKIAREVIVQAWDE